MTVHWTEAAVDALVTYLDGALSGITVRKGFPEAGVDLDLSEPVLSVELGPSEEEPVPALAIDRADASGTRTLTYRVAWGTLQVQLDLWCGYRAVREVQAHLVEAALRPDVPYHVDLRIASTGYYSRPLTATLGPGQALDDGDSAAASEWRQTWAVEVKTDVVAVTTQPTPTARAPAFEIDADGVITPESAP